MTASAYEFKFVDAPPPPNRGRNALYKAFREALRARPGEWAIWPREFKTASTASATVANITKGRMPTFPIGEFEARSSSSTVYVRYIGGES